MSFISNMNYGRKLFAVTHNNKNIYAIGGIENLQELDNIEKYDISKGEWTILGITLPVTLHSFGAC